MDAQTLAGNFRNLESKGLEESILIDLYFCNKDLIASEVHIREYIEKLLKILDMEPYGGCHLVHHGKDANDLGYSAFQCANAFSISGHFVQEQQKVYIHIFTNSSYDLEELAQFSKQFFEAKKHLVHKNIRY